MTHEYTVLTGGVILAHGLGARGDHPPATALAWAEDTILAVGGDAEVRAVSRGDSRFIDLRGAVVVPWRDPLEPGASADFDVIEAGPAGSPAPGPIIAVVRGGHVEQGRLGP